MPTALKPSPQTGLSTFSWRAQVDTINGVVPTTQTTNFYVGNYGPPYYAPRGPTITTTGTASTGWQHADASILIGLDESSRAIINQPFSNGNYDGFMFILAVKNALTGNAYSPGYTVVSGQFQCHETGTITSWSAELFEIYVGVMFWRDPAKLANGRRIGIGMTGGTPHVQTLDNHLRLLYEQAFDDLVVTPPPTPDLITLGDTFQQIDYGTDRAEAQAELIQTMGHNSLAGLGFSAGYSKGYADGGLDKIGLISYSIPGYMWKYGAAGTIGPELPTPAGIAALANRLSSDLATTPFAPDQLLIANISDEPGSHFPLELDSVISGTGNCRDAAAQADALADFRAYLAAQGLTSSDIGGPLSSALPLGQSNWNGTLAQRKLLYWSMRWYAHYAATLNVDITTALKAKFPNILTATNWNNFQGRFLSPANYYTGAGGDNGTICHDWFEFGELGGGTCLWTGLWMPDTAAQWTSAYANVLSSIARHSPAGTTFGAYVILQQTGFVPGGVTLKSMALIGHGAKAIHHFLFGPAPYSGVDARSFQYLNSPYIVPEMAEVARIVSATETELYNGVKPPADVAILFPRSSLVYDTQMYPDFSPLDGAQWWWFFGTVDYMLEAWVTSSMLSYKNIDHEFISEDQLNSTDLSQYKVLYVTVPNIPAAAQTAIVNWTNSGGTLVTYPGAGTADEYNTANTTVSSLGGVSESARTRMGIGSALGQVDTVNVNGPGGSAPFSTTNVSGFSGSPHPYWRSVVTPPVSATVEATFSDNSNPAITVVPVSAGKRVHFAGWPGARTLQPFLTFSTSSAQLAEGWDETLIDWIARPVTTHSLAVNNVTSSEMFIETPYLATASGAAITVLNWNNGSKVTDLTIRPVTPNGALASLASASSYYEGALTAVDQLDGTYLISGFPVDYVDVITVEFGPTPVAPNAPRYLVATPVAGDRINLSWETPINTSYTLGGRRRF